MSPSIDMVHPLSLSDQSGSRIEEHYDTKSLVNIDE